MKTIFESSQRHKHPYLPVLFAVIQRAEAHLVSRQVDLLAGLEILQQAVCACIRIYMQGKNQLVTQGSRVDR